MSGRVYRIKKRWYVDYYDRSGKRHRYVVDVATKTGAEKKLAEAITNDSARPRRRGGPKPPKLAEAHAEYMAAEASNHPPNWIKEVRRMKAFVEWFGADRAPGEATARDVSNWARIRAADLAPSAVHRELSVISSFWKWVIAVKDAAEFNPVRDAWKPPMKRTPRYGLTIADARAILDSLKGEPILEPAYLLAFCNGVCRGEIVNVRWEHIDIEAETIHIPAGKTENRRATMRIHPRLLEWLKANAQASGWLFLARNPAGRLRTTPMSAAVLDLYRKRYNAGISCRANLRVAAPPERPLLPPMHRGRHTIGTNLVQKGVALERVSRVLRHARTKTTEEFYAHLRPIDCGDELDKLNF